MTENDELISRQDAINAIKARLDAAKTWYDEADEESIRIRADSAMTSFLECILTLKKLPSVEPNLQPTCNQLATDCISRQALIDAFSIQTDDDGFWCGTAQDMEELLKGLPSVEPEIIRCKDCKHCWESHIPELGSRFCGYIDQYVDDDDFCSNGEAER